MEKQNVNVEQKTESKLTKVKVRNIGVVTRDMYELIPEDSEKYKTMRYEMKKFILDPLPFRPPEMIFSNYFWDILNDIVNKYVTMEDSQNIEWCKKFIEIYLDPDYKISESLCRGDKEC